jgi:hypothetical protein
MIRSALRRAALAFLLLTVLSATGCIIVKERHDHGLHKGHGKHDKR